MNKIYVHLLDIIMSISFTSNLSRNIYIAIKDTGGSNEIYKIHKANDLHKIAYYEFMRFIDTQKKNWPLVDAGWQLPEITSLKCTKNTRNGQEYTFTMLTYDNDDNNSYQKIVDLNYDIFVCLKPDEPPRRGYGGHVMSPYRDDLEKWVNAQNDLEERGRAGGGSKNKLVKKNMTKKKLAIKNKTNIKKKSTTTKKIK